MSSIYQEPDAGLLHARGPEPGPAISFSSARATTRRARCAFSISPRPEKGLTPHRAARDEPRLPGRASRRPPHHPHQCGRRRGLQARGGAHRCARPRELARSRAPQAGAAHPRLHLLQGLPRAARTRGRPAAHRRPPLRRWRGARHRVRRGGLFARHVGRLRIRHRNARASPIRP